MRPSGPWFSKALKAGAKRAFKGLKVKVQLRGRGTDKLIDSTGEETALSCTSCTSLLSLWIWSSRVLAEAPSSALPSHRGDPGMLRRPWLNVIPSCWAEPGGSARCCPSRSLSAPSQDTGQGQPGPCGMHTLLWLRLTRHPLDTCALKVVPEKGT